MALFDSHHHLNHPDFEGKEKEIWNEAVKAGIREGVVIGYDIPSSQKAIALAEDIDGLYASVGVSPHDVMNASEDYLSQLEALAGHPKVAAIGEAGLEYHHPTGPKEIQQRFLIEQAQLASKLNKPLVIHLRDADEDFLNILDSGFISSAILHCFTASQKVMEKAVSLGFYISFSGIVTFKKAKEIQYAASLVPSENLLIETDSPYLAPVPYRGKVCQPKMIVETAKKIAELRDESFETISQVTYENARKVFNLDGIYSD